MPGRSRVWRIWTLAAVNACLLALVLGSATLVARATGFAADPRTENAIVYDGRLLSFDAAVQGRQVRLSGKGRASVYLVRTRAEVLSGAQVAVSVPFLGFRGALAERSPGVYSIDLAEEAIFSVDTAAESLERFRGRLESWSLNGKQVRSLSFTDYVAEAGLQAAGQPTTYDVPFALSFTVRLVDDAGRPLANTPITLTLPGHGYTETVVTDGEGVLRYTRQESVRLSVAGGQFAALASPLALPAASPLEFIAAWPGDDGPTPTPGPKLCLTATTSKNTYMLGEEVQVQGQTTDCNGKAASGASVAVKITDPDGKTALDRTVGSDEAGSYAVAYKAAPPQGSYQVSVTATKGGETANASATYQIKGDVSLALEPKDWQKQVDVPLSSGAAKYSVYRRGDSLGTEVKLTPNQPIDPPTDFTVRVELFKKGRSSPTDSREQTVSVGGGEITVNPPIGFKLPRDLAAGYYELKASVLTTDASSTRLDEKTKPIAVVFSEATGPMAARFVDSNTAQWGHNGGFGQTFTLSLDSPKVFKYTLDGIDGKTSVMSAAVALRDKTTFLQSWTESFPTVSTVEGVYGSCDLESPSENCALSGQGQCFFYGNGLTAFLREAGIPGRPVSGGVGGGAAGPVIGMKDPNERPTVRHPKLEVPICWSYHVWTEGRIDGSWYVLDANQGGFGGTQADYGATYIDNYCAVAGRDFNPNGLPLGYFRGSPHGTLVAEDLGGAPERLDGTYGVPGTVLGLGEAGQASTGPAASPVRFQSRFYRLGEPLRLEVTLDNPGATTRTFALGTQVDGMHQGSVFESLVGRPVTVFTRGESVDVPAGATQTVVYEVLASAYGGVGMGLYGARVTIDGAPFIATAAVTGRLDVDVGAPATVGRGDPLTITATITNPSDQTVGGLTVSSDNPDFAPQTIASLGPRGSATVAWSTTTAAAGRVGASVWVRGADVGESLVIGHVDVLSPAALRIYRVGLPERVEVGQPFEITADVWNPGSAPLDGVAVSLRPATPGLLSLSGGPTRTIPRLDADGWATVTWPATALQAGQLVGRVDATAGALGASAPLSALLAEPGHAVDLVVDGVGRDVVGGSVQSSSSTAPGTNYLRLQYPVVVRNTGAAPDTLLLTVSPLGDAVAVFTDGGSTAGRQRTVQLAPGAAASFTLALRSWRDAATAAVELRSLGDPSRSDYMLVGLSRNDQTALRVTPKRLDLTIQHGRSESRTIEIANNGGTPLSDVTLQPEGQIAGWLALRPDRIAQIDPGQPATADLVVTVPKYQAPGNYSGSVRVRTGDQSEIVVVNVQVPESHAVLLDLGPDLVRIVPGNTAVYGARLQNEGNVTDSYTLSLAGPPPSWEVSWSRNPVLLEPGAVANVDLMVVPPRSPSTSPGRLDLTATAQNGFASASDGAGLELLSFHELDLNGTGTSVAAGPPVVATKVWKKAHAQPQGKLDLIIRTRGPATPAHESALAGHGASVKRRFKLVDGLAASVPAGRLGAVAAEPFVASVELDEPVVAVAGTPANVAMVNVGGLRSRGVDGTGVVVAIVDTGVGRSHPALPHRVPGYDFVNGDDDPDDDNGHGTHVAGIVGANDADHPGVAPGARLMPVKVLDAAGVGASSDVIAGVEFAVGHGAQVINLSLNTGSAGDGAAALSQAVDNAVKSGVLVVSAAGNSGPDYRTVGSPGDARLGLTVGALVDASTVADFSSRGPTLDGRVKPDLLAPGVSVTSTWTGGGFTAKSGTSMAAPHVAGVVALLRQAYPSSPALVREALLATAAPLAGYDANTQGRGRVDGDAAAAYLQHKVAAGTAAVRPGDTAAYSFVLTNRGNVDDGAALSFAADPLPASVSVDPSAVPATWVDAPATVAILPAGGQTGVSARVAVPASWAGMEPATYRFRVVAASQAEPGVADAEPGSLTVQPTKRSKLEYGRLEVGWLRDSASPLAGPSGLVAKLDAVRAKLDDAVDGAARGDAIRADTSTSTAINQIAAFVQQVQAQRGKQIDPAAADGLVGRASALTGHLRDARATGLP